MSEQNLDSVESVVSKVDENVEFENLPSWSAPSVMVLNIADLTNAAGGAGFDGIACASS